MENEVGGVHDATTSLEFGNAYNVRYPTLWRMNAEYWLNPGVHISELDHC
jgi:hypothetical protein